MTSTQKQKQYGWQQMDDNTLLIKDRYPTRVAAESIITREEPVVYGKGDRKNILSQQDLAFYAENGYLIKPGLLADKVEAVLDDIPAMQVALKNQSELILEPDSEVVRSIFSPELHSDVCMELAKEPCLKEAAEQILDSDVYIHHSRINVKSGLSGKSFPWHSDFETWHSEDGVPSMRIVTGWVFLTDNTEFNGSLYVIPQSHKHFVSCAGQTPNDNYKTSLRNQTYGVPSKEVLADMVNDFGIKGVYGPPGTVVFHEGNLMHGSPDNLSPLPRTNIFFVYNSVENTPVKPFGGTNPRPPFLARKFIEPLK